MERTNFNKDLKMHLACAKNDETRPVMNCIYFKDGFAYASDSHILVKNKLDECSTLEASFIEALDGKILSANNYKDILKYDEILIAEDGIEATKGTDKAFFYFEKNLTYPNAESVIQSALNKQHIALSEVGLNTKLLVKLNEALSGAGSCKLQFYGAGNAVVLQGMEQASLGIIMPVLLSE